MAVEEGVCRRIVRGIRVPDHLAVIVHVQQGR